jgi:hypothetical protein
MTISQEEFRQALEGLDNSEELLEYHNSAVLSEKNRGVEQNRKNNKQNQNLQQYKRFVEELGWDGQTSLEEFKESLTENDSKSSGEIQDLNKNLLKLQKEFEKSQVQLQQEREQRANLEKVNKIKTIESTLSPKLSDKFYGSNFMIKALLADGAVDLDENGNVVFKKDDDLLNIDEGIKWLSDTHSDARKNLQRGGIGSNPTGISAKTKYTLDQIKAMTPQQIADDVSEVNKSMAILNGTG